MRRLAFLSALLLTFFAVLPGDAQSTKDSPAAAATRKRLKEKISVELKNEMLREVFKEIAGKLEELKKGSLSQTNEQGTGINMNTRITVVAKDKPVDEILDEMLKPLELGYIVVSKPGDRTDGFLLIKKGNLRGDDVPADGKEKKKEEAKAKVKEKNEMPDEKKGKAEAPGDDEKDATRLLNNAKNYVSFKKPDKAKEVLKELLEKHPSSKAAEEAKSLLEKLDK